MIRIELMNFSFGLFMFSLPLSNHSSSSSHSSLAPSSSPRYLPCPGEPSCSSRLASSTATSSTAPGPQPSQNHPPPHSSPGIVFHPWTFTRPSTPLFMLFLSPCCSPERRPFHLLKHLRAWTHPVRLVACLGLPHGFKTFDVVQQYDHIFAWNKYLIPYQPAIIHP